MPPKSHLLPPHRLQTAATWEFKTHAFVRAAVTYKRAVRITTHECLLQGRLLIGRFVLLWLHTHWPDSNVVWQKRNNSLLPWTPCLLTFTFSIIICPKHSLAGENPWTIPHEKRHLFLDVRFLMNEMDNPTWNFIASLLCVLSIGWFQRYIF